MDCRGGNQHEPLVDRKTFDIVQRKLKSRQRPRADRGNQPVCGAYQMRRVREVADYPLHQCRSTRSRFIPVRPTMPTESSTVPSTGLSTTPCTACAERKIRECARAALMDGEAVAGTAVRHLRSRAARQREALERSLAKGRGTH